MLSKDRFMPNMFMIRGDRLGFSNGIIVLAFLSGILIVLSGGDTENLIPLYALGVFIPFTLSQAGMMKRWITLKPSRWYIPFTVNTIGMLTTLTISLIFLFTKISQVWTIFLFIPVVVILFKKTSEHYQNLADQLRIDVVTEKPEIKGSVIVIPVSGITKVVSNSIGYAKSLTDDVIAVYIGFDDESIEKMERKWKEWNPGVRLVGVRSRYRSVVRPLMKFIDTIELKRDATNHVTVLIPEFIPKRWWQRLLHNQTGLLLRAYLFNRQDVKITTVPFRLKK